MPQKVTGLGGLLVVKEMSMLSFTRRKGKKSDTVGDAIEMKSILYLCNLLRKGLTKEPRKVGDKKSTKAFLNLFILLYFCFSQNQFVSEKCLNFF